MARIVDSILVDDNGPDQSTELDQRVPVTAVASQPGRFDREHGPDAALADRRQQALEARPIDATCRSTQIVVDDLNAGPTEPPRALGEPVLSALALAIVHELISRRLTDVDVRASCKMLRRNLGHRRSPRLQVLSLSQEHLHQRRQRDLLCGLQHDARLVLVEQAQLWTFEWACHCRLSPTVSRTGESLEAYRSRRAEIAKY